MALQRTKQHPVLYLSDPSLGQVPHICKKRHFITITQDVKKAVGTGQQCVSAAQPQTHRDALRFSRQLDHSLRSSAAEFLKEGIQ